MKTFETEKHNIPEGATHYMNQTSYTYFAWGKFVGEKLHLMLASESEWTSVSAGIFDGLKPIPQTNIETPEENDVEWVNGDECISSAGYKLTFIGMCNHSRFDCILLSEMGVPTFGFVKELSKPETPRQLEERERKEARAGIERLLEDRINFHNSMLPKTISKIIYDAGYRKEG